MKNFGTIKFYDEKKGFGFIKAYGSTKELFFHITDCVGEMKDYGGVEFTIGQNRKGECAKQISMNDNAFGLHLEKVREEKLRIQQENQRIIDELLEKGETKYYFLAQSKSMGRNYHISESKTKTNCSRVRNKLAPFMYVEAVNETHAWNVLDDLERQSKAPRYGDEWKMYGGGMTYEEVSEELLNPNLPFYHNTWDFIYGVRALAVVHLDGRFEQLKADDLEAEKRRQREKEKKKEEIEKLRNAKTREDLEGLPLKIMELRDRRGNNPKKPFRRVLVDAKEEDLKGRGAFWLHGYKFTIDLDDKIIGPEYFGSVMEW